MTTPKTARKLKKVAAPNNHSHGRPSFDFKPEEIEIFGRFRATQETIADFYGVSVDTIRRRMQDEDSTFCKAYKKGFAKTKRALSEMQLFVALEERSVSMLIWLGKQYLNQSDQICSQIDAKQPIKLIVDADDLNA